MSYAAYLFFYDVVNAMRDSGTVSLKHAIVERLKTMSRTSKLQLRDALRELASMVEATI